MAFTTPGVKATWPNPGANVPPDAQKQPGGWYYNPSTGSVDRWFPDNATTASGLSPTGTTPSGGQDYFSQAMSVLQPITESQVAPLKAEQDLIPKEFEITKQQIGQQQMAQVGSQRAEAAAKGIPSSSGVEQSQEANIAATWAGKLAMLPVQEAQSLLQVASQIAQIQGQGTKEALTYASDLAKLASENAYRQAEIALSQGRNDIAAARLQETTDYHNASLTLRQATAGGGKPSYIDLQAQALAQEISQGKFKSVGDAMAAHPELSANTVFTIWTTQKGTTPLPTGFGQSGANIVAQPGTSSGGSFNIGNLPIIGGPLQGAGDFLGGIPGALRSLIPGQ